MLSGILCRQTFGALNTLVGLIVQFRMSNEEDSWGPLLLNRVEKVGF